MSTPLDEFLRLHRENYFRAYTVADLARFIGVSRMTVHRWLRGSYQPSEKQVLKIRAFLAAEKSA